jgi:hypothetical protein
MKPELAEERPRQWDNESQVVWAAWSGFQLTAGPSLVGNNDLDARRPCFKLVWGKGCCEEASVQQVPS